MSSDQELLTLLNNRISKTTKLIKEKQADALVIFNQANYRFLTNFSGEEAELILTANGDRVLLSDSRFKDQIRHQAPGEMKVVMQTMDVIKEIAFCKVSNSSSSFMLRTVSTNSAFKIKLRSGQACLRASN